MDILKLTFENLNSLAGRWEIDFSGEAFRREGIFAITGPTGAGKTTILDAICLALYGQTPRLGKISGTKNEIMSRRTNFCSSEVTFRTKQGIFRVSFMQSRAKRRGEQDSEGNLQKIRREFTKITDSETGEGEILASRETDVQNLVQEHVGLNFSQFTQAVLLAQGKFAEFLHAKASDRGTILEKLTKTDIYSKISQEVYRRFLDEKNAGLRLKAGLEKIRFLPPEELTEYEKRAAELEAENLRMGTEQRTLEEHLSWLRKIAELEDAERKIAAEETLLKSRKEAFLPNQKKRQRAESAAEIEPQFLCFRNAETTFFSLEKERREIRETLKKEKLEADSLSEKIAELQKTLAESAADENLAAFLPGLTEQVSAFFSLTDKISRKEKELAGSEKKLRTLKTSAEEAEAEMTGKDAEIQAVSGRRISLEATRAELLGNRSAEAFQETLEVVRRQGELFRELKNDWEDFSERLAEKTQAGERITALQEKREHLAEEVRDAEEKWKKQDAAVREWEETLLRETAAAGQQKLRESLRPGDACPVCGSTEHPYAAEKYSPEPEKTRRRLHAEKKNLETCVREREEKNRELHSTENELRVYEKTAARHAEKLETLLQALSEKTESSGRKFFSDEEGGFSETAPEFIVFMTEETADIRRKLSELDAEENALKENLLAVRAKDREIADSQKKTENLRKEWSAFQKRFQDAKLNEEIFAAKLEKDREIWQAEIQNVRVLRENMWEKVKPFFAETPENPDWEKLIKDLQTRADLHAERKSLLEKTENLRGARLAAVSIRKDSLEKSSEKLRAAESAYHEAQRMWDAVLEKAGFSSLTEFQASRLSPEKREALRRAEEELTHDEISLATRRTENETALTAERQKLLTEKTTEVLAQEIETLKKSRQENAHAQGEISQMLRASRENEARWAEESEKLRKQDAETARWSALNEMIGSAGGDAFKNFAQYLTFTTLLQRANVHLRRIMNRYVLFPSENADKLEEMEILVQDNDQAGILRTAKNLSGGESFLVSLALALALAGMAGKETRLESLFLDEGFGTLDEETLEDALNALTAVQQSGKLIGVISHIPALHERLGTRIEIRRISEGRSEISGPGVKKVRSS